ncbi:hypothetical protein [Tunturiibacter gelidoferens]|uniref:Uncharacterized protein n=1 Tax=Tunturiibacter lichenicola TaxID=2051959 RepID=A0A7Y9NP18_9BACT|nr:hypothetical protein [Edaphobacter lichenicola]NYF52923.1 hypothetical protein [Edaphobacter lichenicola]
MAQKKGVVRDTGTINGADLATLAGGTAFAEDAEGRCGFLGQAIFVM